MKSTRVIGIDPGIVHTGVVYLRFNPVHRDVKVVHTVIVGADAAAVGTWVRPIPDARIFIEHYRIRGAGSTHDKEMLKAVDDIKTATGGKVLDNTGVVKIVKPGILQVLGAWTFSTPTHHNDLRSAARIAVLGMMKDPEMNRLLADVIRDHLAGKSWTVTT